MNVYFPIIILSLNFNECSLICKTMMMLKKEKKNEHERYMKIEIFFFPSRLCRLKQFLTQIVKGKRKSQEKETFVLIDFISALHNGENGL